MVMFLSSGFVMVLVGVVWVMWKLLIYEVMSMLVSMNSMIVRNDVMCSVIDVWCVIMLLVFILMNVVLCVMSIVRLMSLYSSVNGFSSV